MQIRFKDGHLIASPETELEASDLVAWKELHAGHVLLVQLNGGEGLSLRDLGPQPIACREPLNVTSEHSDAEVRLISNFALTPFVLANEPYNSVEGFWQGLKFESAADRRRLALADPHVAKHAGHKQGYEEFVTWQAKSIRVGSPSHWQLMQQACWAKFTQHAEARAALVATAPRPLTHRVRRDSVAIPGVVMADIWMRIRDQLRLTS